MKIFPVVVHRAGGGAPVVRWSPDGGELAQDQDLGLEGLQMISGLDHIQAVDLFQVGPELELAQIQEIGFFQAAMAASLIQDHDVALSDMQLATDLQQLQTIDIYEAAFGSELRQTQALAASMRAAPTWRSVATNQDGGGALGASSHTCNKPADTTEGDLLIAWVGAWASGLTLSPPDASWTGIVIPVNGNHKSAAWWKIAGPSEPASYTFTSNINGTFWTSEIHRIDGHNPAAPINDSQAQGNDQVDPTSPSVTTTIPNCLVLACVRHEHDATQSHAPPSGHVERTDFATLNVTQINSSTYSRVYPSTGATGSVTVNCSQTLSRAKVSARIAITPGEVSLS